MRFNSIRGRWKRLIGGVLVLSALLFLCCLVVVSSWPEALSLERFHLGNVTAVILAAPDEAKTPSAVAVRNPDLLESSNRDDSIPASPCDEDDEGFWSGEFEYAVDDSVPDAPGLEETHRPERASVPSSNSDKPLPPETGAFAPGTREVAVGGEVFVEVATSARRQIFFASGQLYWDAPLIDGMESGLCRSWHRNGQLASSVACVNGMEDGILTRYTARGLMYIEGNYRLGQRNGIWRTWYDNGLQQSEGEYRDNVQEGWWRFWTATGDVDQEATGTFVRGARKSR